MQLPVSNCVQLKYGYHQGWIKCGSGEHRSQEMTRKIEEIIALGYEEKERREEEERKEEGKKRRRKEKTGEKKKEEAETEELTEKEEHGDHRDDKLKSSEANEWEHWVEIRKQQK